MARKNRGGRRAGKQVSKHCKNEINTNDIVSSMTDLRNEIT